MKIYLNFLKMNKKGNLASILSKKELIIAIIFLLIIGSWAWSNSGADTTPLENNQKLISEELGIKTDSIIRKLDSQNSALYLLNKNLESLDNTKADKTAVQNIQIKVNQLNNNYEAINKNVEEIKETIKVIEPSYVQNIDLKDMRTYINIFNFRLIINFFIAISLSLLAVEGFKIVGSFFSYAKATNNWDIKNYLKYKKTNKIHKIVKKIETHNYYKKQKNK
jgi:hypothetical protein